MSVRVRFAPSPTGYLHIGGARTALYNFLFAKVVGGEYVLRIEDTDQERSKKEYEDVVMDDLKWLGIEHTEGPDKPGKFGPYRQSERTEIYQKHAQELIDKGLAYYCFCSQEELEAKKEKAMAENGDPRYDGTCREVSKEEALKRIENGEEGVIRFKAYAKDYTFTDKVRGEVTFPEGMVGDFVIMRSNGLPVYNYCCVVDDWLMEITHVVRAEDHLANTLRQLMIYEAFGAKAPEFAHVSLLVGKDRQKLSKRHGTTAVGLYKEDGYLPEALNNYLLQLGWSHPEEQDIYNMEEVLSVFNLDRFNKSAATFDMAKLAWVNGQHLRLQEAGEIVDRVQALLPTVHPFYAYELEAKMQTIELYKEKCDFYKDFVPFIDGLFDQAPEGDENLEEILSWESTPLIKEYLKGEVDRLIESESDFASEEDFANWSTHIKKELKIKGKFLFMGMRGVLTGVGHGSDLKTTVQITPLTILKARLG